MPHTLTIEIPDDVYESLEREAVLWARTVEEVILDRVRKGRFHRVRKQELTEEERASAMAELQKHTVDLGYPTGADNEQIDRDLAEEYANTHEGEA